MGTTASSQQEQKTSEQPAIAPKDPESTTDSSAEVESDSADQQQEERRNVNGRHIEMARNSKSHHHQVESSSSSTILVTNSMAPSKMKQDQQQQALSAVASPQAGGGRKSNSSHGRAATPTATERRDDFLLTPKKRAVVKDEQVQVNLAMADLMAYLQVVANNSSNLPLTKRDDPDAKGVMTDLSSEEYARKSAAFIPADVRVMGGSFLKYGKVWDLPTSEEYTALDGAQEPGRSYGGACCNSMLKVLYDAASNAADEAQNAVEESALFDDDDDESLGTLPFARNETFASLDMNGQSNPSTLTWAELLRKMKTEMAEIEYAQNPTISATRKFDLNQPFSLVPESFDTATGKKRSLLIGCNYKNMEGAELKASHDDVRSMKDYIVNVHGFPESDDMMKILMDDDEHDEPTFHNITEAFKSLSEQSQPGDAVFIQFSGHGGRILDAPLDPKAESYDEMIAPSDYATYGLIRDTLIFKTLLAPMRYGVTVTIIVDCCDTGMMIDLPYRWSTRSDRKPGSTAKMTQSEDFSFVRFLKVVKTLYESSTFTQLGKTVGTALGQQPVLKGTFDEDESGTAGESTLHSRDGIDKFEQGQRSLTLFSQLCMSPKTESDVVSKKEREREGGAMTLIEQVLGCNFLINDVVDDDDGTFHEAFTFDSEEYKRRKRRSRSRSRKHR